MTERLMPEPHHYAVCPPEGIRIRNFYTGYYSEIFICLHPFLVPVNIDPNLFYPETWPGKASIRDNTKPFTWEKFLEFSNLKSISSLDIALRTRINGLNLRHQNLEDANSVDVALEKHNLIEPSEGHFPEILFDKWASTLISLGHKWVWLGDEHCTERKLHFVQDLLDRSDIPDERCMFTHQNEMLFTTHWDSHFTLICGNKSDVEKVIMQCHLEGFYCTEETEIYWSIHS